MPGILENIRDWIPTEVVNVCKELVRIPSENPPGDVRAVAQYVAEYLCAANIKPAVIYKTRHKSNVVAEIDFGPGPCLILNGHMDVVPAGDPTQWEFDPFGGEVTDGYVLGRGASDMKGGLAGLLVALKKLVSCAGLSGKILFMAVADEETGGWHGTRWLLERGLGGDACLIAEPSGINPTIGQKGALWLLIKTYGKSVHGSLSPAAGDNAIIRMMRAIDLLYGLWQVEWDIPFEAQNLIRKTQQLLRDSGLALQASVLNRVTVNVGKISGGEKVNVVPAYCLAEFDLRVPIGVKVLEVFEHVQTILKEQLACPVEIEMLGEGMDGNYTSPTHPFVALLLRAIQYVTGCPAQPLMQWASSDARFFRQRGIPTAQFGPADLQGIHGFNERVPIDQLMWATKVYLLLSYCFLHSGGENLVAGNN